MPKNKKNDIRFDEEKLQEDLEEILKDQSSEEVKEPLILDKKIQIINPGFQELEQVNTLEGRTTQIIKEESPTQQPQTTIYDINNRPAGTANLPYDIGGQSSYDLQRVGDNYTTPQADTSRNFNVGETQEEQELRKRKEERRLWG